MPQAAAALALGISLRQVQRMVASYKSRGEDGLRHGLAGRPSNNSRLASRKQEDVNIVKEKYPGAGPTLAAKMLSSRHGIQACKETVRKWLVDAGVWEAGGSGKAVRRRRQRKSCLGEPVQGGASELV